MGEVKVDRIGSRLNMSGDVEAVTLNLDIDKLLELQEKYTKLECECNSLWLFVQAVKYGRCAVMPHFENEYLGQIAEVVAYSFRPMTDEERSQEFAKAKEVLERVNNE